jgi:hypothetical protein
LYTMRQMTHSRRPWDHAYGPHMRIRDLEEANS